MRIFVFEYSTGGGLAEQPMDAGLAREGDMMLAALTGDLLDIPGVEVRTTRDTRMTDLGVGVGVCPVSNRDELLRAWAGEVSEAEAVWPIAPETDGILEFITGWVELAGRALLNSRSCAVNIAASKNATARRLGAHGLPVIPTRPATKLPPAGEDCWVLKPDRGVGCIGARLVRSRQNLTDLVSALPPFEDWVIQPYLPGLSASLSVLVGGEEVALLGCNLQRVVLNDDRFVLLGCEINALAGDRSLYTRLAQDIVRALPGLWGYVGIDLLITGSGPVILEVNPRLTTSYVGLSRSLGANAAAMVVDLVRGIDCPPRDRLRPQRVDVDLEQYHVA